MLLLLMLTLCQAPGEPLTEARFIRDLDTRSAGSTLADLTAAGGKLYFLLNFNRLMAFDPETETATLLLEREIHSIIAALPGGLLLDPAAGDRRPFFFRFDTGETVSLPFKSTNNEVLAITERHVYFEYFINMAGGGRYGIAVTDGSPEGTRILGSVDRIGRSLALEDSLWVVEFPRDGDPILWVARLNQSEPRLTQVQPVLAHYLGDLAVRGGNGYFFESRNDQTILWQLTSSGQIHRVRSFTSVARGGSEILGDPLDGSLDLAFFGNFGEGRGLWQSDGSEAGTRLRLSFGPDMGLYSGLWTAPLDQRPTLSLVGIPSVSELGAYVADLTHGTLTFLREFPSYNRIVPLDRGAGGLWFRAEPQPDAASSVTFGSEQGLWFTSGTGEETRQLLSVEPKAEVNALTWHDVADGRGFFFARAGNGKWRLWASDGTLAGTMPVPSNEPNSGAEMTEAAFLQGGLYFWGASERFGSELMVFDGNANELAADLSGGEPDPFAIELIPFRDRLVFTAATPELGIEAWETDGTVAAPIQDLFVGAGSSTPSDFAVHKGNLYFQADEAFGNHSFWRWDGNGDFVSLQEDPPVKLKPANLFSHGEYLYFAGFADCKGIELYRTNGEPGAIELFANIGQDRFDAPYCYELSGAPDDFTSYGPDLILSAYSYTHEPRAWFLVPEGARELRTLAYGHRTIAGPLILENSLYHVDPITQQPGVWRLQRGAEDWELVAEFPPDPDRSEVTLRLGGAFAKGILIFRSVSYFLEERLDLEAWMWAEPEGELRLLRRLEIDLAIGRQVPQTAVLQGAEHLSRLFFTFAEAGIGEELFVTDGTGSGTFPVADLVPGPAGSQPRELTRIQGRLMFSAETPGLGREPWQVDMATLEPRLLVDLVPGPNGSDPRGFVLVGRNLFLVGESDNGPALFAMGVSAVRAGNDQRVCGTATLLDATLPPDATGHWEQLQGMDGFIAEPNDPQSPFEGLPGEVYLLSWQVALTDGSTASDLVRIDFFEEPDMADAGSDREVCREYSIALDAEPVESGSGRWEVVEGHGTFQSMFDPKTRFVTSEPLQERYILRWTVSNGSCEPVSDEVVIQARALGPRLAGSDQVVCGFSTSLDAVPAWEGATGRWEIASGQGGRLIDPTQPDSILVGRRGKTYALIWRLESETCGQVPATVRVNFSTDPETCGAVEEPGVIPRQMNP